MSVLVRPRVVSQITGESLFLEDALEPVLAGAETGAICLFGALGSGKSSALMHLSSRLPKSPIVELLDDPERSRVAETADRMVVIYTAPEPLPIRHLATFWLAPWGQDEALEYLLSRHPGRCGSVMRRMGRDVVETPELWAICLDEMAADESVVDLDAALRKHLHCRIPPRFLKQARAIAFRKTAKPETTEGDYVSLWGHPGFLGILMGHRITKENIHLLRHPRVGMLLAAERLVDHGKRGVFLAGLESPLPRELISRAGALLRNKPEAVAALERELPGRPMAQPMGASLLHAAGRGWKPNEKSAFCWFSNAYFNQADWPALRLPSAHLGGADLTGARLSRSKLDNATLRGATLRGATLWGASLMAVNAAGADLSRANLGHVSADNGVFVNATLDGADLEGAHLPSARFDGASLRGSRFRRANLTGASFQFRLPDSPKADLAGVDFTGAELEGAWLQDMDLRTASLSGARFVGAHLEDAILEGVEAPGAFFEWAFLKNALLTGSVMHGASFRKADLSGARLGDIDWEKVDLRDADLTKVNFHMGSSRSGLVFGEPSEGTRSGFYTDEYYDQSYRAPEEFRTANLRGADLRGAVINGTDFYLVDLREAHYTSGQEAWFRRCGAILETRV